VLSKLIELMVGVYTTSPRKDQKRTRLRIRAELFLKALRRNIAATAQLADAAKWEHFFATEYVPLACLHSFFFFFFFFFFFAFVLPGLSSEPNTFLGLKRRGQAVSGGTS
jgi:hypothetical protein